KVNYSFTKADEPVDLGLISVSANIKGTVVSTDGLPIVGGYVQIEYIGDGNSPSEWFSAAVDQNGEFKITAPARDGEYRVRNYMNSSLTRFTTAYYRFAMENGAMTSGGEPVDQLRIAISSKFVLKDTADSTAG